MLLAADEASLYLQASLMRVWAPVGQTPVVRVAAGRDSTHLYGALDLATGGQVTLRSGLMNSEASALFLSRVLAAYPSRPILLLWDRATWHKGEAIRSVLSAHPRLEIVWFPPGCPELNPWFPPGCPELNPWFPPGCPELNPQEHVWKATREAVSHNHSFDRLPELADAFEAHLTGTRFPCSLLDKHGYHELRATSK